MKKKISIYHNIFSVILIVILIIRLINVMKFGLTYSNYKSSNLLLTELPEPGIETYILYVLILTLSIVGSIFFLLKKKIGLTLLNITLYSLLYYNTVPVSERKILTIIIMIVQVCALPIFNMKFVSEGLNYSKEQKVKYNIIGLILAILLFGIDFMIGYYQAESILQ